MSGMDSPLTQRLGTYKNSGTLERRITYNTLQSLLITTISNSGKFIVHRALEHFTYLKLRS